MPIDPHSIWYLKPSYIRYVKDPEVWNLWSCESMQAEFLK